MPTTPQTPIKTNELINRLKLLPGDWMIKISNKEGDFYISDLVVDVYPNLSDCIVNLVLTKIP